MLKKIADKTEITEGKIKEYKVNDLVIDVLLSNGKYYAFSGLCTHMGCPLAGGTLVGNELTCFCHGAKFDITTGMVLAPPATKPLITYSAEVKNGEIYIDL